MSQRVDEYRSKAVLWSSVLYSFCLVAFLNISSFLILSRGLHVEGCVTHHFCREMMLQERGGGFDVTASFSPELKKWATERKVRHTTACTQRHGSITEEVMN